MKDFHKLFTLTLNLAYQSYMASILLGEIMNFRAYLSPPSTYKVLHNPNFIFYFPNVTIEFGNILYYLYWDHLKYHLPKYQL